MSNRDVDINVNVKAGNANKELNGVANNIQKVEKTSKSASKSIAQEFLKAELAMKAMKAAVGLASDSMKIFAERSGDNTFKTLNDQIDKIKFQIGSQLTKEIAKFTSYFKDNEQQILQTVAKLVQGFLGLKDTIVGVFMVVGNTAFLAIEGMVYAIVDLIEKEISILSSAISKLPFIPADWKKSIADFSEGVSGFKNNLKDDMKNTATTIGQGAGLVVAGIKRMQEAASDKKIKLAVMGASKEETAEAEKIAKEHADFMAKLNDEMAKNALTNAQHHYDGMKDMLEGWIKEYKKNQDTILSFDQTYFDMSRKYSEQIRDLKIADALKERDERLKTKNLTKSDEAQIEKSYNEKVLGYKNEHLVRMESTEKSYAKRAQEIAKEKEDAIKTITDNAFDAYVSTMKNNFDQERAETSKAYADKEQLVAEALENEQVTREDAAAAIVALEEAKEAKLADITKREFEYKISEVGKYVGYVQTALGQLNDVSSAYSSLRTMEIDKEVEDKKFAANQTIKNKRELDRELSKIDKDAAEKRRKLAKTEMLMNIAMAIASGAQATINGLKTIPFFPLGIIMGGIAAALSTIQVGIMFSQYSKMAKGGVVGGQGNQDTEPTMLTPGEIVMNRQQQANTLMAIANGKSGGGGANISIGDTQVIIQGNADETVVNNALKVNRQKQMENMRQLLKDMQYSGSLRMQVA